MFTIVIRKIRGGGLNPVEYEVQTFLPGKNLKMLGFEKKRFALEPVNGTVSMRAPARIRHIVLDANRCAPDPPWVGGRSMEEYVKTRSRDSQPIRIRDPLL
ncbi:MAG: hypothetical protein WCX22_09380 [Methanoregula sp.]